MWGWWKKKKKNLTKRNKKSFIIFWLCICIRISYTYIFIHHYYYNTVKRYNTILCAQRKSDCAHREWANGENCNGELSCKFLKVFLLLYRCWCLFDLASKKYKKWIVFMVIGAIFIIVKVRALIKYNIIILYMLLFGYVFFLAFLFPTKKVFSQMIVCVIVVLTYF